MVLEIEKIVKLCLMIIYQALTREEIMKQKLARQRV